MPFGLFKPSAPMRVQPFYGYRTATHIHLTARALRSKPSRFDSSTLIGGFRTMLREYISHEVGGVEVTLTFTTGDGRVVRGTEITDGEGFARFAVPFGDAYDLPMATGWERATLNWDGVPDRYDAGESHAHILVPGRSAGIGIISDIDDTILETGITGGFRAISRNWRRVMAQMPSQRAIVPGATDFYGALGGGPVSAGETVDPDPKTHVPKARPRPIFYVSSSPWNLFNYLVAFKRSRGMPLGPIALRDWGLNRDTFGSGSHGAHKTDAIRRIVSGYPDLKFALVGDDTQRDLIAFGEIVSEMPERIAAVFIRRIAEDLPNSEEQAAQKLIEAAGVPFWMGEDYGAARAFLEQAGLDMDAEVEELVKTASEGQDAAAKPATSEA